MVLVTAAGGTAASYRETVNFFWAGNFTKKKCNFTHSKERHIYLLMQLQSIFVLTVPDLKLGDNWDVAFRAFLDGYSIIRFIQNIEEEKNRIFQFQVQAKQLNVHNKITLKARDIYLKLYFKRLIKYFYMIFFLCVF